MKLGFLPFAPRPPNCDDEYLEGLDSAIRLIEGRLVHIRETGEAYPAKVELRQVVRWRC